MANKVKIDISKEYNLLSVFFDDGSKMEEIPQTTDSTDLETLLTSLKVGIWEIKTICVDVINSRILIFSETFISETIQSEEFIIADLTAPQQTIVNDFIALF